jgi:hypothetical protein
MPAMTLSWPGRAAVAFLVACVAFRTAADAGTPPPFSLTPLPHEGAVVTLGNARFSILTPGVIRAEWAADGPTFDDEGTVFVFNRRVGPAGAC